MNIVKISSEIPLALSNNLVYNFSQKTLSVRAALPPRGNAQVGSFFFCGEVITSTDHPPTKRL